MRRLPVLIGLFAMLVAPACALAARSATGDGSLVVKNGSGAYGVPVVVLQISGSVIGNVDHGKLVIDAGPNVESAKQPQITGTSCAVGTTKSDTAEVCKGNDFRFRAVGGKYTVLVYGSGIDLVAVGRGTVQLTGIPDTPVGDGRYSLNNDDFVSLPGTPTKQLTIGSSG